MKSVDFIDDGFGEGFEWFRFVVGLQVEQQGFGDQEVLIIDNNLEFDLFECIVGMLFVVFWVDLCFWCDVCVLVWEGFDGVG